MCSNNGLQVDILPEPKLRLTELENNIIALNIVFQKFHLKPKSRWSGTHDRLVNVPISQQDIKKTLKALPRTPAEAGIIPVGLKRKLEYKTTHLQQLIDIKKIYKYLHYLIYISKSKYYKIFDDVDSFMERCQNQDPEGFESINPEVDDILEILDSCQTKADPEDEMNAENDSDSEKDNEKEDFEYRTKDVVRKYQFDYDMTDMEIVQ